MNDKKITIFITHVNRKEKYCKILCLDKYDLLIQIRGIMQEDITIESQSYHR